MTGHEADRSDACRDAEESRGGDRLAGSEQGVEGYGGALRFGGVSMPVAVDEVDPGAARTLGDAPRAAGEAEIHPVGEPRGGRGCGHALDGQAPVVEAPWLADRDEPLRPGERDGQADHQVPASGNDQPTEGPERGRASAGDGENARHHQEHHRCQGSEDEENVEDRHVWPRAVERRVLYMVEYLRAQPRGKCEVDEMPSSSATALRTGQVLEDPRLVPGGGDR